MPHVQQELPSKFMFIESIKVNKWIIFDLEFDLSDYMQRAIDGSWQCVSCDYNSKNKSHVQHHIESKHVLVKYSCEFCSTTCPTKMALNMHVLRKHKSFQ